MTFDWFRRRYDNKAEEAQTVETEPVSSDAAATAEPVVAEATAEAEPVVADDYLNWAKAAYQNIQKRQQAEAPPAEIMVPPDPTSAVETTIAPEATSDTDATIADSATITDDSVAEIPDAPVAEIIAATEPVVDQPLEPETPTPLPFWAQSEADRQERLERLKQSAIVEPEPAIVPSSATVTASVEPLLDDVVLDEGFLWSSEILAAQGRRPDQISLEEITWLKRLRQGLDKTRRSLINQLRSIVGQGPLNEDAVIEIESVLLQADVGVAATDAIIAALQSKLRQDVLPPDAAITYLKQILREMLDTPLEKAKTRFFAPEDDVLNIWLITGVNGAGKTTTIGKLAHIAQKSGYKCLIAAADTFRAAAVEQVKVWGGRSGVEVIANPGQNTDPAAVVFDAIAAAQSRGTDLLLVDTAGRLQNKKNLMDELSKIRRIIDKKSANAVVESLLVLDATLGQNGLRQAEVFAEAAQLSGVILTKLDGTAKGGIALAIVQQLGLPIRFIGAGEGIEDLRPFSSYEFVEALLNG
ncbi:MAG: signal recognition particle-docking protein FtsY [Stenomitos frigidus ULC029]